MHATHMQDDRVALVIAVLFDIGAENKDLTDLYFGDKNIPVTPSPISPYMCARMCVRSCIRA